MAGKHIKKQTLRGEVVFKDVTFGYSKENPSKDVRPCKAREQCLWDLGAGNHGCPSTRFYDVDKGTITLTVKIYKSLREMPLGNVWAW